MCLKYAMTMLLVAGCAKNGGVASVCKVTTDCKAGLLCVDGACKVNSGSGLACTTDTDCKSQEACVSGKCGEYGCDASHACNDGCCDSGQCVITTACSGGLACGTNGTCPGRCDTASGGVGCTAGCCDISSGTCVDGTADNACGATGGACSDCGSVAVCDAQACACADASCDGVCVNAGCTPCASDPCNGDTPVCDDANTHECQPCSPGFCATTATPYCTQSGACSATPDSPAACIALNPYAPDIVAGACGCDPAKNDCPAGTTCDTTANACDAADGVACTADKACQSGHCDCSNADCTTLVCSSNGPCEPCEFAYPPGTAGVGECDNTNIIGPGTTTPSCGTTGCSGTSCACNGIGSGSSGCTLNIGQICAQPSDCASGFCDANSANGGYNVCGLAECVCGYTTDNGQTCGGTVSYGAFTDGCPPAGSDCTALGGDCCSTGGQCKHNDGEPCTSGLGCLSGLCAPVGEAGTEECVPNVPTCDSQCQYIDLVAGWTGDTCPAGGCTAAACANKTKGTFCSGGECLGGACENPGTCSSTCDISDVCKATTPTACEVGGVDTGATATRTTDTCAIGTVSSGGVITSCTGHAICSCKF